MQPLGVTVWRFLIKLDIYLLYNNSTPRYLPERNEDVCPHKDLSVNVYSLFSNCPKLKTTPVSFNRMKRQTNDSVFIQ